MSMDRDIRTTQARVIGPRKAGSGRAAGEMGFRDMVRVLSMPNGTAPLGPRRSSGAGYGPIHTPKLPETISGVDRNSVRACRLLECLSNFPAGKDPVHQTRQLA